MLESLTPRAGCQTNAWRINPQNFAEVLAVVEKIRGYGYAGFETGFRNVQTQFENPREARAKFDATGMHLIGVHIFLNDYDPATGTAPMDLIERVATGAASLGAERLIVSGAPCRSPEALNRAGKFCASKRLRLCYHNHGPEFAQAGPPIETILAQTDPHLVSLMMDAGHAFHSGANVLDFFNRHHQRIDGMHLRDWKNGEQVILGEGEFDLKPLAAAIRKHHWTGWIMNEEERLNDIKPGDSAVKPAREQLRKVFGV